MTSTQTQNPFHAYLAAQLLEKIHDRSVVVWHDERGEFAGFIAELRGKDTIEECVPERVQLDGTEATLICSNGSLFETKIVAEPLVCGTEIDPLVIYLPGEEEKPKANPLLELELLGTRVKWKLAQMARFCLQKFLSDDQIDQVLKAEGNITYADIVSVIAKLDGPGAVLEGGRQTGSILDALFKDARNAAETIAAWLATPDSDNAIEKKGARGEILRLSGKLGHIPKESVELTNLRMQVARHILINEFVLDLDGDPPAITAMIVKAKSAEQQKLLRDTASALRRHHGDAYEAIADAVEGEFQLGVDVVAVENLGSIDTFKFEERALLCRAGEMIVDGSFEEAQRLVSVHHRCFWADRDPMRQQQWEACSRMALLGRAIQDVRESMPKTSDSTVTWIHRYTDPATGWYRMDAAYRQLQSHLASMTDDPESETAKHAVLNAYELAVGDLAEGFVSSLQRHSWQFPEDVYRQVDVFDELVGPHIRDEGPMVLLLADSLRFEMGIELASQFTDAKAIQVRPCIAAFPTITPIGMAALLPGASRSFDVVDAEGKLGAQIDGRVMTSLKDRKRYLEGKIPGCKDITLDELLSISDAKIKSRLHGCRLLVVRSQDIDQIGEGMQTGLARQVMDTAVGNIARGIRRLARNGCSRIVVAADHGHVFGQERDQSMRLDTPAGEQVELHRRVWCGRGGATPTAAVRVSASELGYASNIDFVVPRGVGVFRAGGDLAYHHGGLSLQEAVVPVLTLELHAQSAAPEVGIEADIRDVPGKITNRAFRVTVTLSPRGLFDADRMTVRASLISNDGREVGTVGQAIDADFDSVSKSVSIGIGRTATLLMLLQRDATEASVVIEDATSKALLYRSPTPIPIDVL